MVTRDIIPELRRAAAEYPIVTITGPRQSGKTTLARTCFPEKPYYSLESPDTRAAVAADPRSFLDHLPDGAVLDEVQRLPDLLSYLQEAVDAQSGRGLFILTGSHQPLLQQAISQSLAGRTAVLHLLPFSVSELRHYGALDDPFPLLVRGFYPRLHEEKLDPRRFYSNYLQTYLERDVRLLLNVRDLTSFQHFLVLMAGRVGQPANLAALSSDLGLSATTLRAWISVLTASHVLFSLPPFSGNLRKRLVKAPKPYFTDVGLAAALLGIHDGTQALQHPLRGPLYENMVIAEVLKGAANRGLRPDLSFYRDSHGNEVDLLVREAGRLVPVEIKSSATFSIDFLKGLDHLRATGLEALDQGVVLANCKEDLLVRGMRVMNPWRVDNLWQALTTPAPSAATT
ncbi:MAG: ATP-binding protein [bacterium]|jgi:hypothetical protein|nr:ATP-binding protein [bacterium]